MKLMLWKQDEGPTDVEFKQGDIFQVKSDGWTPGSAEDLPWLIVQMEDYGGPWEELVAPEFTVGATPEENVMRRQRKYFIDFSGLTPSQKDKLLNPQTHTGVVSGLFGISDIKRRGE